MAYDLRFSMYDLHLTMGGSGKRSLPMARGICVNTIGKLRKLRLPLPPLFVTLTGAERSCGFV